MSRWEREHADHVYEDTVSRPGPILRSRALDDRPEAPEMTDASGRADTVTCPTCGSVLPGVATACPADGTRFDTP